ncbi:4'-phosphopantetheinyl transferase family protein [Streptomyces peucetius]|uniref:4'-phosphopantetheinyl transferase superfamily protein n=1 Tax=Streptomyces peucetius TaxID=1950 RepID=A0ABY6IM08_STRPE|nr:4'-phosphopantetheinyl transferase superfamily protein [Streptomyces peucetius]UYQ66730.1 4'-phosphopantetheinyl transferase superfamily protein [Streptomyces peucetius]
MRADGVEQRATPGAPECDHRPGPVPAGPSPAVLGGDSSLPAPWTPGSGPRLWIVRVSEYQDRAAAREAVLDEEELARCRGFVRAADRDRYRVGHVALRLLLGAYLGLDPAAVRLIREPCPGCGEPHGRPAVATASPHFSLSHAEDAVLLAFAEAPVGVDIEAVPEAGTAAEVGELLHRAERAELAALAPSARPAAVGRCWARKEAYLKGVGIGLGEDPSVTYVGTGAAPGSVPGWTITDVPAFPGYAAACAVRTGSSDAGAG